MLLRELPFTVEFERIFVAGAKCVGRSCPVPFIFVGDRTDVSVGRGEPPTDGAGLEGSSEETVSSASFGGRGAWGNLKSVGNGLGCRLGFLRAGLGI